MEPENEPTGQDQVVPETSAAPEEPSKPWADYLSDVPETFIPIFEPQLQKFYEDQQAAVADLKSKYEPFDAVIENSDPQFIQQALQLASEIQQNPEQIMRGLAQHLGYDIDEDNDDENYDAEDFDDDEDDEETNPRLIELQNQVRLQHDALTKLSKLELDKAQAEAQRRDDEALTSYLDDLKTKHPDHYDEDLVLLYLSNGRPAEEAIEYRRSLGGPPKATPRVLGSGALPSNQRPVTELSKSEVQDHVVAMIKATQQANS